MSKYHDCGDYNVPITHILYRRIYTNTSNYGKQTFSLIKRLIVDSNFTRLRYGFNYVNEERIAVTNARFII